MRSHGCEIGSEEGAVSGKDSGWGQRWKGGGGRMSGKHAGEKEKVFKE